MSNETVEAVKSLDSLSVDEVFKSFREALALGACHQAGPRIEFGDFGLGEPICVRFVFNAFLDQEQLQSMLARATALGLQMDRLEFHRKELSFSARTKLLKP